MKFYLILIIAIIGLAGCGTEAADNGNVNTENTAVNEENSNAGNVSNENVNAANAEISEEIEDEEVPKFEDAKEALDKGTEYFDKNRNEMAIDAFKQAVELDPDLAEAHFKLGVAYALEEAEEEAKVQPADEEEETEATKKKKKEKEKKKQSVIAFENAVKAYKKFVSKNPKDAEAFYNLGRAYNKLGDKNDQDARKALEKAVKLDDENSVYRTELGEILNKLAKYEDAIRQLNKAIALDENNFRAEDLLEEAKAGKKRVDFGANKIN